MKNKYESFKNVEDPIDFLIENNFRVDHAFSNLADNDSILKIEKAMPEDSELFLKLKKVADKSSNNFSYSYLVKIVAGFSTLWNSDENINQ